MTSGLTGAVSTRLGLGTGALGNLFAEVSSHDARDVLDAAIAAGIDLIDTAPHYGRGLAERRVGAWLASAERPPYLSTKVGRVLRPIQPGEAIDAEGFVAADPYAAEPDYSADGVMRSMEGSLGRLGVARVDALLMHDLGRQTWGTQHECYLKQAMDGGFARLAQLKDQGVTDAIGLGVNETEIVDQIWDAVDLDVVLLANRHTLLDHAAWTGGFFERAADRGVRIVLGGVFNSGLLADVSADEAHYEYGRPPEAVLHRAQEIARICEAHGVPMGAAALNFCRRTPGIDRVLIGPRTVGELKLAVEWWNLPMPADLWRALGVSQIVSGV